MIPRNDTFVERQSWQTLLAQVITDPEVLLNQLQLLDKIPKPSHALLKQFPLRVPLGFVARMKIGDPHDPLLRQILPLDAELVPQAGYTRDPLNEANTNPISGVLHKYHGRVLVTVTGACAIHCRYCFRRHFPYIENNPGKQGWQSIQTYLEQDDSIEEVILSGGDPLTTKDDYLAAIISRLENIKHIKRLRIHSRIPIVLPQRITTKLIQRLQQTRLQTVMVVHCNHANEIDETVLQAFHLLNAAGITTLNQTVLLRGVNDTSDALISLSKALFQGRVLPYYLHLLDPVQGAQHFNVSEQKALQLMQAVTASLPGFLVPKLAKEKPGDKSKFVYR